MVSEHLGNNRCLSNWLQKEGQPPLCLHMIGPLPLRWGSCTGRSTVCSPQPAADARPAAKEAGRGSPSPAPPHAVNRQAATRSLLHSGKGVQSPLSGPVAESRPRTFGPAQREGASRRPGAYRRHKAGQLPDVGHVSRGNASRSAMRASVTTVEVDWFFWTGPIVNL